MHLRKALTVGAAVLATGLIGLTAASQATNPTGGPIAYVGVNGPLPIDGTLQSGGTTSYGGGTFGCSSGAVAGEVQQGTRPLGSGHDMVLDSFSLTCATGIGVNGTIALDPSCPTATVDVDFSDSNVHTSLVDVGTGTKFSRVDGTATFPGSSCVRMTAGPCTANVSGTTPAYFDEAVTTISGVPYQKLILDGSGLVFSGQSAFCFGALSGVITLTNVTYNVKVLPTSIDFQG